MQLALTDDEAKFRDQLREFYTTEIPEEIREWVRQGVVDHADIATSQKILNANGLAGAELALKSSRSVSCRRPPTSTSGGVRASPNPRPAPTSRRCGPPRSATVRATS